jgi:site-specific DNA-methyltransferase (adenine-specific)
MNEDKCAEGEQCSQAFLSDGTPYPIYCEKHNILNKVYLGSCVDLLPSLIFELKARKLNYVLVSDPPFNIGYHYDGFKDRIDEDDYFNLLETIFGTEPHVIIHYPEVLHKHSYINGVFPNKIVAWVYNSNTAKQHRDIAFYNCIPDFKKVGQPYKNPTDKRIMERIKQGKKARLYDWWYVNQVKNVSKSKTDHPCQMPLIVMERIIGLLPEDIIIIDPFCGSGTTLVAAKIMNRQFIGIDISEKYVTIAKERLSQNVLCESVSLNDKKRKVE